MVNLSKFYMYVTVVDDYFFLSNETRYMYIFFITEKRI